ncbi:hypothetical protein LSUCC0031_05110 [Rhodobacterales bacterium LSUCC0031]|nr:hypothetical protein [Rhodobacterales bacterium LSUCC0031]
MAKTKDQWREILKVTVALEVAKTERDAYFTRLEEMRAQLAAVTARAERAEERLAETTRMLFDLGRDAVTQRPQSTATEVMVEGRSVLRLSRPVGMDTARNLHWSQG